MIKSMEFKYHLKNFWLLVILMTVVTLLIFIPSGLASAQTNGDAGGFVPCGNEVGNPCNISHLFRAFVVIINYLIGMAGFLAVLFIVVAGVQMVYSQGQDGLKDAKGRLSGAVTGMVLVSISFIVINTLFEGSLSLGIKNGGLVFTNPREYISQETRGVASEPVVEEPVTGDEVIAGDGTAVKASSSASLAGQFVGQDPLGNPQIDDSFNNDCLRAMRSVPNWHSLLIAQVYACVEGETSRYAWLTDGTVRNGQLAGPRYDQTKIPSKYSSFCTDSSDTYAQGGCFAATMAAVFTHYGHSTSTTSIGERLYHYSEKRVGSNNQATVLNIEKNLPSIRYCGRGTSADGVPIMAAWFGLMAPRVSKSEIYTMLNNEVPVVVVVGKQPFTGSGHFVVLWKLENDPDGVIVHMSDSSGKNITQSRLDILLDAIKVTGTSGYTYQSGSLQAWAVFDRPTTVYNKLISSNSNRGVAEAKAIPFYGKGN